jgi:hypothetical protein
MTKTRNEPAHPCHCSPSNHDTSSPKATMHRVECEPALRSLGAGGFRSSPRTSLGLEHRLGEFWLAVLFCFCCQKRMRECLFLTFAAKSKAKAPPRFKKHDGRQALSYSGACGTRSRCSLKHPRLAGYAKAGLSRFLSRRGNCIRLQRIIFWQIGV